MKSLAINRPRGSKLRTQSSPALRKSSVVDLFSSVVVELSVVLFLDGEFDIEDRLDRLLDRDASLGPRIVRGNQASIRAQGEAGVRGASR